MHVPEHVPGLNMHEYPGYDHIWDMMFTNSQNNLLFTSLYTWILVSWHEIKLLWTFEWQSTIQAWLVYHIFPRQRVKKKKKSQINMSWPFIEVSCHCHSTGWGTFGEEHGIISQLFGVVIVKNSVDIVLIL